MPGHKDKGQMCERETSKTSNGNGSNARNTKCKQMLLILCRQHLKQEIFRMNPGLQQELETLMKAGIAEKRADLCIFRNR